MYNLMVNLLNLQNANTTEDIHEYLTRFSLTWVIFTDLVTFVTRPGKPTMWAQEVKSILLLHIIDIFIHYDDITRGGQVFYVKH